MKQVLQELNSGKTILEEAPTPLIKKGHLLIQTSCSLISVGTEKMLVDFSQRNYFQKAKQQPEKVKMVLDKVKTEGLLTTIDAVQSKLSQPLPLGYCNVGKVIEVGEDVEGFQVGDRVVSNGPHADIVLAPQNLCAKIPESVSDEEASFVVVSSIGLQAIRLANPTLGEYFVVSGVGLIGLLTVQILLSHGCKVLALDYDEKKLELAKSFGAEVCNLTHVEDPVEFGINFSRGNGVDGVIIAASTASNDPISHAAQMSRKRGRIILLGVTGMKLNRSEFYEKELSFQVSCSYGPGRYDDNYERRGQDYPFGFVRWTEKRNFEAILDLLERKKMNTSRFIQKKYKFEDAEKAFHSLVSETGILGVLLEYSKSNSSLELPKTVALKEKPLKDGEPILSFLGAGNYASRVLIPAFKKNAAQFDMISSQGGLSAAVTGRKLGFKKVTTSNDEVFKSKETNTIVIATQHNTHAELVRKALLNGKNTFVEKPLAIQLSDIDEIESFYNSPEGYKPYLMIGFNRRFSSLAIKMKSLLSSLRSPMAINMIINSGNVPIGHWTQNLKIGGGRIVGEACHFIDFSRFLTGSPIISSSVEFLGGKTDTVCISLRFKDGSIASINYFSNGSKELSKERIEVFCEGKVLHLDNFLKLRGYGWKTFKSKRLWRQDKGQGNCCKEFLRAVKNGTPSPIPLDEVFEVSRVAIEVSEKMNRVQ